MKIVFTILFLAIPILLELIAPFQRNNLIEETYRDYFDQRFDEVISNVNYLEDSLQFEHDGMKLNRAHAFYKSARFGNLKGAAEDLVDSTYLDQVAQAMSHYAVLFEKDKELSSIAYLQSGMIIFKSGVMNGKAIEPLPLIDGAMAYYKNALLADYTNDEARYNYETLKRFREFPDQLMKKVEDLVTDRKYEEAYMLLAPYAETDPRFTDKKEYAQRLGQIVQIEYGITPQQ